MTDKFQYIHTGKRTLSGLTVNSYGGTGTFNSNKVNSALFGQALSVPAASTVYFDVSDDSLSFTGNTTQVAAFTMGAFSWGPGATNIPWFVVVPHSATFSGDFFGSYSKWRLAMYLIQNTAEAAVLCFTNTAGTIADYGTHGISVPTAVRSGWVHLAFTYDPNVKGGNLKGFINGALILNKTNVVLSVFGAAGAYFAFLVTSTDLFLFSSSFNYLYK